MVGLLRSHRSVHSGGCFGFWLLAWPFWLGGWLLVGRLSGMSTGEVHEW